MKATRLFPFEWMRLVRSRLTLAVMGLTLLSPAAGLFLYRRATAGTMTSAYLANPSIAGGAAGAVLFGLLAIFEADRAARSRMEALLDAAVSPLAAALARVLALLAVSATAFFLTALAWLPFCLWRIGPVLDAKNYLPAWLLFMGLALPLGILAASAAYQFTHRLDLSAALFVLLAALSLTVWGDDWQLCWLNPCVWALSDDFSNLRVFRSVAWMRLTWLAFLCGVWGVSALCTRRYGKGALGSFLCSARRLRRPAAALLLLACSAAAYLNQPMVDHSNPDLSVRALYEYPTAQGVFCTGAAAWIFPDTGSGSVFASASYQLENSAGEGRTVAFAVNPGYIISNVRVNGQACAFSVGDYQEYNQALLTVELPPDAWVELTMDYGGFPRESSLISSAQGRLEISEEYLCLENSNLMPCLINAPFTGSSQSTAIEITLPKALTLIPFGPEEAEVTARHEDGFRTWRCQTFGTGGIFYAGDYVQERIDAGGMRIEFYYSRKHQSIMESIGAADAVRRAADYCAARYGPLFSGAGGTLKLIQSRVTGGGYAGVGASLLDELDFTADNLANREKGAAAGEVMLHELSHQWWGLGVMFDLADPDGAWSSEGLTCYTTYRIVKELYGEEYAADRYAEQWRRAVADYNQNFYVRCPEYLEQLPEDKQLQVLNSLTYVRQYCEMPLKILKAEQLVGGEEAMDQILASLFTAERDPLYPYLTYEEFLDACGLTKEDLHLD